jgi:hypothetical protein
MVLLVKGNAVIFLIRRVALSHPQNAPPGFTESAISDDSPFFVTVTV